MKTFFSLTVVSLTLILAAGCSKPRPPAELLDAEISKTLPSYLALSCPTHQYSPIHEVLGTTLPAGSFQVDIQCRVRAKEPLYDFLNPQREPQDPHLPAAYQKELPELKALAEWSAHLARSMDPKRKSNAPQFVGFLVVEAEKGSEKEVWVKAVAEPRGQGWLINLVEGEPQSAFSPARPRSAFPAEALVDGSDEQRKVLAQLRTDYQEAQRERAIVKELAPRVAEIRSHQFELSERYYREVGVKFQTLEAVRIAAAHDHEQRIQEINRSTSSLRDDYKTRDELVHKESRRFEQFQATELRPQYATLEAERNDTSPRAHREIEAKVAELAKQAGIDPSALSEDALRFAEYP